VDAKLLGRLRTRRGPLRKRRRLPAVSERTRAFFNAAFLAAIVLFAMDESLSKPSVMGRFHAMAHSDLDNDARSRSTLNANFHVSRDAVVEYLSEVADMYQD
jgi:hypothetical protein